jgi:hypothetical protein
VDALIWKECGCCSRLFQPQREAQRWCCPECRAEGRAAEQRSARELWRRQGRPVLDEPRREQIDQEEVMRVIRARLGLHEVEQQEERRRA